VNDVRFYLFVRVAGTQALAHNQPQIMRKRSIGIIYGLILADDAAQLLADGPRAPLEFWIGELFAGKYGKGRRREQKCCEQEQDKSLHGLESNLSIGNEVLFLRSGIQSAAAESARTGALGNGAVAETRSAPRASAPPQALKQNRSAARSDRK
jgi:hypothetical protein